MDWRCPDDHDVLLRRDGALVCPRCTSEYDCPEAIPLFARGRQDEERSRREAPVLAELWESMRREPIERAVQSFCAAHACSHNPLGADWKFFFPVPAGGRVLEIGSGFGADVPELARRAAEVVCLVPSVVNALIVERQLNESGVHNFAVAVNADLSRLPFADRSIHAIAMEDAASVAFGVTVRGFSRVAAEWKRVLVPGGSVFVGLTNRLARLPARSLSAPRDPRSPRRESLNRVIKRAGHTGSGLPGLRRTTRILRQQGFGPPAIYAPLPDERKTQLVIPVDDVQVVQYCLHYLVRQNSPVVRMAIGAASLATRMGWFRHCVPYHFLFFKLPAADPLARA